MMKLDKSGQSWHCPFCDRKELSLWELENHLRSNKHVRYKLEHDTTVGAFCLIKKIMSDELAFFDLVVMI